MNLPGGDSAVVPPDPMPNSAVKRRSADGSVGSPHVRVGNCQALYPVNTLSVSWGFLRFWGMILSADLPIYLLRPILISFKKLG